jgi:hypothetical protein
LGLFLLTTALFAVNFLTTSISGDERPNFTTLADSLLALFIVLTGENWVEIAVQSIAGTSWFTAIFFYVFYAIGNYVLLNFVIVILITSFNQASDRLRQEDQMEAERLRKEVLMMAHAATKEEGDVTLFATAGGGTLAAASEIAFVDFSTEAAREQEQQRADPTPPMPDLANQQSGFHSDGGEYAAPHSARTANSVASPTKRSVLAPESPMPQIDVLDLRHRQFPLESVFRSIVRAIGEPLSDEEIRTRIQGRSFKIFAEDNAFRFYVAKLVCHPVFELFVTLVILESCVALGFENPTNRRDAGVQSFLDINSIVLVVLFAVEALLRCVAFGVFAGDDAYLRDSWNCIDFFVLLVSFIAIFFPTAKALRSLRVFRLAAKIRATRVVISAVVSAVPGIANVFLLIAFTFVVFGILGVQLFKGSFVMCNDESITVRMNCTGYFEQTTTWYQAINGTTYTHQTTVLTERRWEHDFFNFNHLGYAVLTLLQQMYNDGWSSVLFSAMDATNYDTAQRVNASPVNALFFVVFVMVGNFFLINLFVGSLVDSFSHERNVSVGKIDKDGNPLLTEEQDGWIRTYRVMSAATLLPYITKATNPIRRICQWVYFADGFRLAPNLKFEWFITCAIILNAILMCTTHADQPSWWTDTLFYSNLSFAVLFAVEAVLKIIALLPAAYVVDPWNRFDLLMVPVAFISLFLGGPGTNAIRVLRVGRVLRLVKRAKGLKRLFDSLLYALPQLVNISMLLLLTLFVFGVVGVSFFAEVAMDQEGYPLNEYFNFSDAFQAMMLLFQIATTESWPDVMRACMMTPETSACTYEAGNCGSWVSIPFFVLFMLCANSVAMNLFIFVIVDNYMEVNSMNDPEVQLLFYRLSLFRTSWSILDRDGSQRVRWDQFMLVLRRIMRETVDDASDVLIADAPTQNDVEDARIDLKRGEKEEARLDQGRGFRTRQDSIASGAMVNTQKAIVDYILQRKEAGFMRLLHRLDIPIDEEGLVRYHDCVYALTREHFGLDLGATRQAARFLNLHRDRDPGTFFDSFKVHHALAVRKIMRLLRMRQREARLQVKVKMLFRRAAKPVKVDNDGVDEMTETPSERSESAEPSSSKRAPSSSHTRTPIGDAHL